MPTRRVRVVVLVIEFFLKFLLLLGGFRRVLRGGWWIVALFQGARGRRIAGSLNRDDGRLANLTGK
jgi:hypothetical protein